jgi:adenosylcobinamide-GDP ribazoletransferase
VPEALRLAVTTLTVLPVRGPERLDRPTAGRAMGLAPLVGVLLALVAGGVAFLVRLLGGGDLLAAALAVATLALLSRGLHLDGLADLADGLASYRDPAGTREVMKSPGIGPVGVSVLVLVLLVQVAALEQCYADHRGTACLVLAVATGRLAVTAACHGVPSATPSGLGALVAGTVPARVPVLWTAALACAFGAYAVVDPHGESVGLELLRTTAALGLGLAAAHVLRAHAVRRVGGLTGDLLGAQVEVTTTVVLVVLALGS